MNWLATARIAGGLASREIAKSSSAYSRVSDAPLGTGEIESDWVLGT